MMWPILTKGQFKLALPTHITEVCEADSSHTLSPIRATADSVENGSHLASSHCVPYPELDPRAVREFLHLFFRPYRPDFVA